MEDFSALMQGERALLEALNRRGIPFMIVGLSAAVLQGANSSTRDIDLWFADTSDPRLGEAIREAKGIWISGTFGAWPPQIGGDAIGECPALNVRLASSQDVSSPLASFLLNSTERFSWNSVFPHPTA
jgi:hypothetical protein